MPFGRAFVLAIKWKIYFRLAHDKLRHHMLEIETTFATTCTTTLDLEQTTALLEMFSNIGIGAWLTQHPFAGLHFKPRVLLGEIEVYGLYSYLERTAEIAVAREENSFGQALVWGKIDKLSYAAPNALDAVLYTMLHELGHHVHNCLRAAELFQFALSLRTIRSDGVSHYAKKSTAPIEYFAENFLAWVVAREALFQNDKLAYAMISQALKTLQLEVGA